MIFFLMSFISNWFGLWMVELGIWWCIKDNICVIMKNLSCARMCLYMSAYVGVGLWDLGLERVLNGRGKKMFI